MDTVLDTAEVQNNPGDIDVLAFLEGVEYPEREVVLFTDSKAADKYVALNREEKIDEAELDALAAKMRETSLVFSLRGLPPGVVSDVYGTPGDDEVLAKENDLIAATIYHVKNGKGVESPKLDSAGVAKLRRYLKEGEFSKLVKAVIEVNFDATVFDTAVDAGFSR